MPAKDVYHDAIKNALVKDGWIIFADPYKIKYKDTELFADLAIERPIANEHNGRKIIVEIKSFLSASPMRDFELALGEYILYRNLINLTEPEYQVYLAIKDSIYENFFNGIRNLALICRSGQIIYHFQLVISLATLVKIK
ncbi:XisH protein [Nostoc sp. MBR 210]|nr:XisH protein [Nostoc sp. MBR 210]